MSKSAEEWAVRLMHEYTRCKTVWCPRCTVSAGIRHCDQKQIADAITALTAQRDALRGRIKNLEDFVETVRDGFDCDGDAHKYHTICRCCAAAELLTPKEPQP